ncbi:MAG: diguanylate cyclase [Treponema sp.]|nr:diguanylate cyclase [Treponema sp.]
MNEKFISFLSQKKTLLFLLMCLFVHAFNALLFYFLGIYPLTVLNIFSTLFYIGVLLLFKRNTDFYIIFTYLEIVSFSLISELISGGAFFYIFYVVGMISAMFYLIPTTTKLKQVFQGIGILFALAIYYVYMKKTCLFPEYSSIVEACKTRIGLLNLCITLFTLFYISNLYFFELNTTKAKLTYSSDHDLLTGLFNRRFLEHIINRNISENENEYTIALFDIDDFKKINDTYGHQAGDKVLKVVSSFIEDCPCKEYVPVRWGGEEFILFMPQTNASKAKDYLTGLRKKIADTVVDFESQKIKVTVTIGMSTGRGLSDYEALIRVADERLYKGKHNGKNCLISE